MSGEGNRIMLTAGTEEHSEMVSANAALWFC
jgi:hypothetical protein